MCLPFRHSQGSYKFFCFRRNKMIQKNNAVFLPFCNALMCPDYRGLYVDGVVPHSSELQCFIQRAHHIQGIVPLCNTTHTFQHITATGQTGHLYVLIPDVLGCSQCFPGERVYNTSSSIWRIKSSCSTSAYDFKQLKPQ